MKDEYVTYKDYIVVYVVHPATPNYSCNARRRKRHLAVSLEGKSLCNMDVQFGEKKLPWNSPMQEVTEPKHGAGETCKVCWDKAL